MTDKQKMLRDYDRHMLRSSFLSLFWNVISERKRHGKFTLQQIADALGIHKSGVSRQFSSPPNWTIDKISDIANALDLDLHVEARSRIDGTIFTDSAIRRPAVTTSVPSRRRALRPQPESPVQIATTRIGRVANLAYAPGAL